MQGFRRRNRKKEGGHGAVPIAALLARYQGRLRPPQGIVIRTFCTIVAEELAVSLSVHTVRYQVHTRTISVTSAGPHKSEILFHKQQVLAACKTALGEHGAPLHIV